MYVSKNRVAGSLIEVPLDRLIESCHKSLLTGTIRIESGGRTGTIVLRAGAVDEARFGDLTGDAALAKMQTLQDGEYELSQRLPDLSGALGSAAQLDGEVSDVPLPAIMRHCEENALSCTIIVISEFDRGEVAYRAGDIVAVTLNGKRDDDAIVTIVGWKDARFRIQAPPLDPAIEGWPSVGKEPTMPIRLDSLAPSPPAAAPAADPMAATAVAPAPRPAPSSTVDRVAASAAAPTPAAPPAATAPLDPASGEGRVLLWGFAAAVVVLGILGLLFR